MKFLHINFALRRPAPDYIPMSPPRCNANNFYTVDITFKNMGWRFLCRSRCANGYSGHLWVNDEDGENATIPFFTFRQEDYTVSISHYHKCSQFTYENAFLFIIAALIKRHIFHIFIERFLQGVYNRKTLVRSERMNVLNHFVEKTIEKPGFYVTPIQLGVNLNKQRWIFHPDRAKHQSHYRLLLDSLAETGELSKEGIAYSVTGKALATLAEFEQEQQRHQDNFNSAKTTHRLTIALIGIGVLGVAVRLFTWWHDKG